MTTEILVLPKYQTCCADSGDFSQGNKLGKITNGNFMEGDFLRFSFPCFSLTFLPAKEVTWMSKMETNHTAT